MPVPGIGLYFEEEALTLWEREQAEKLKKRLYDGTQRETWPRREALRDFRHHRQTKWCYAHECKWIRTNTMRKLRRKLARELNSETYYRPVPHDYKTYGWLSW